MASSIPSSSLLCHRAVFIGDSAVGKTSIISQYIYKSCKIEHQTTIGIDFQTVTVDNDDKSVRIQIWDTAGQEKFHSLIPSYARNSTAAVLVYDITLRTSFDNLTKWYSIVTNVANPHIFVVGNKSDLEDQREVPFEDGQKYAKQIGADFFETSARTPSGIDDLFESIANLPIPTIETPVDHSSTITVVLDPVEQPSNSSCIC